MAILLESAVRATFIAAAFALVLRLLRLDSPAVRHTLWTALVVLMLLLPAFTTWGPEIPIGMLPPRSRPEPVVATVTVPIHIGKFTTTAEDFAPTGVPQGSRGASRTPTWPWMDRLALIYGVGFLIFGLRLLAGTWQASALVRRAMLVSGRLTSPRCATPVTTGLVSPLMILPMAWPSWPPHKLDAILAHEREHVRRRDPLFQWLALLNRAIFWFHPLAWWLQRHLARLAEEACDAAVLAQGTDPVAYAAALLQCAEAATLAGGRVQAGMGMPGSALPQRIEHILTAPHHRRATRTRLVGAVLISLMATTIFVAAVPAQAPPTSPAFEVASVKPNKTGGVGILVLPPTGGLLRLINHPLSSLLANAFNVPEDQIVGPAWIRNARFDVLAKTPNTSPIVPEGPNSTRLMMRALLEERFKLAAHLETRSIPKYALVIARSDGRLGPRLRRSATDCAAERAQRVTQPAGVPLVIPDSGRPCGVFRSGASIVADSVSVTQLARVLVGPGPGLALVDRDVVDQTGLPGLFSFTVDLDPSVSIFTTIEEQLGLKLKPTTATADVVVIDHVEQLIEN